MKATLRVIVFFLLSACSLIALADEENRKVVRFANGDLTLGGELYLPEGNGPFPVVLYNHGSAPGMNNSMASAAIAPQFVRNGWAFFMPYRRGQGLSEDQGPYIMDEIRAARWSLFRSADEELVAQHTGPHLDDQLAALEWLQNQAFADANRIATAGNSFGGIQVMLGVAKAPYCAGVNAAGAAQSWEDSEQLQTLLKNAARASNGAVFFIQARNDYDLAASKTLHATMKQAGKPSKVKIYPAFGSNKKEGHSFPYRGVSVWFGDVLAFLNDECKDANPPGS